MGFVITGIIIIIIVSYFVFVLHQQIQKTKEGNYCGSCSGCAHKNECSSVDKNI